MSNKRAKIHKRFFTKKHVPLRGLGAETSAYDYIYLKWMWYYWKNKIVFSIRPNTEQKPLTEALLPVVSHYVVTSCTTAVLEHKQIARGPWSFAVVRVSSNSPWKERRAWITRNAIKSRSHVAGVNGRDRAVSETEAQVWKKDAEKRQERKKIDLIWIAWRQKHQPSFHLIKQTC